VYIELVVEMSFVGFGTRRVDKKNRYGWCAINIEFLHHLLVDEVLHDGESQINHRTTVTTWI